MKKTIKNLTFILPLYLLAKSAISQEVFNQTELKTHLRWNIFADKQELFVVKKGLDIEIKTLNMNLFEALKNEFTKLGSSNSYIKSLKVNDIDIAAGMVGTFVVTLANDDVELFSFYRDSEKKYVLDFWVDQDLVANKASAINEAPVAPVVAPAPVVTAKKIEKPAPVISFKPLTEQDEARNKTLKDFRDFRYGASFIWDYPALSPALTKVINLARKTPEEFFPIADRDFKKNEQEAHLQLTINLYRKKKWGLMYKSIKLFEQKFGDEVAADINDYLRANAILRSNYEQGNSEPEKTAINILANIAERTSQYELKRGIYKYLVSYSTQSEDYVRSLEIGKKLYVATKEQFDMEESVYAAEVMLHSLAKLEQIAVLRNLLADKTIQKQVSKQSRLAYEVYAMLKMNNIDGVIKTYESNQQGLTKPIHETLLYNVAEAYFRNAQYEKANVLFDQYLVDYSYGSMSDAARVRIALGYDLLGKDVEKTIELYRNAINRATGPIYNYEARLRFVAANTIRRINPSKEDLETRVFVENNYGDKFSPSMDLKKLLWEVRLRTLITDKNYDAALAYLNAIQVDSLKPSEKTVFNADGAEIVYGIIVENYKSSNYSKVVQVWEVYKNRYMDKVAMDPYMNFIVGHSYVKLGLYGGFDAIYASFEKLKNTPVRTFPLWVDRQEMNNTGEMLAELMVIRNIKLNNLDLAAKELDELQKKSPNLNMINFYRGMISYRQKKYSQCVESLERFLAQQKKDIIYDSSDVAEMLMAYTNAIYEMGELDKFKRVSQAILVDTANFAKNNKFMKGVKERIAYLEIEILAGEEQAESYLSLENKITDFLSTYAKSEYHGRVRYLQGVTLVANKKPADGQKVFTELLQNSETSEYIKGLVRAEIALMKIKERTI